MKQRFSYGGQAVLEGVMIRGRRFFTLALRRRNGQIHTLCQPLGSLYTGRLYRLPLVRGIVVLVETLVLGLKALEHSARVAMEDVAEGEEEIPRWLLGTTVAFALVLGIGLFVVVPLFLVRLLDPYIASDLVSNLVEGAIRLAVFVAYLWGISLLPDIRRVFAYHGAEHKAVHAYEADLPLEVDAVRPMSTAHARCGTAFLLVVMVVAVLAFAFLGRPPLAWRLLSRIALVPVIAAASYEVIRFGGAHSRNRLIKALLYPGLWLQGLTTRQPDDGQIEVALQAMKAVLAADEGQSDPAAATGQDTQTTTGGPATPSTPPQP